MSTISQSIPTGTWSIDPVHSTIGFRVRHFGVSWFRGSFKDVTGSVTSDENGLASVTGEITIPSLSIDNPQLHGHLLSPDFFDAETHPTGGFRSTSIEQLADDRYRIVGQLTLRGVSHEAALVASVDGVGDDPYGNTRLGITATGEIDRTQWGISFNAPIEGGGVVVGEAVRIQLDVEAVLSQS